VVQGTWYGVRDTHNFWGAPVVQPAPTKFGTKVIVIYSPNRSCVPNLKLLASTVAERSRGSKIFSMLPSPDSCQFLSEKLFLGKLLPKPKLYSKFELASFNDCKNKYGSPNFLDAPLARTPANFGRKSCFSASYSPSPSCIPNLKLLASTVAEINWGSQIFWDAPLARTPSNFGPKSCFLVSYSLSPTFIPNLKLLASMVAEINRRSQNFWDAPLPGPCQFWS